MLFRSDSSPNSSVETRLQGEEKSSPAIRFAEAFSLSIGFVIKRPIKVNTDNQQKHRPQPDDSNHQKYRQELMCAVKRKQEMMVCCTRKHGNDWYEAMMRPVIERERRGAFGEQTDGVPAGGAEAGKGQRCSADQPARPEPGSDSRGQRKTRHCTDGSPGITTEAIREKLNPAARYSAVKRTAGGCMLKKKPLCAGEHDCVRCAGEGQRMEKDGTA